MVVWSVWKSREVRLVFSELVLGDIYLGIFLNKEPLVNLLIHILCYSSETIARLYRNFFMVLMNN